MHKKMPRVEIPHGAFCVWACVAGTWCDAVGRAGPPRAGRRVFLAVQPARLALARAVFQDGVVGHQLARLVPLRAGRKARASPGIGD